MISYNSDNKEKFFKIDIGIGLVLVVISCSLIPVYVIYSIWKCYGINDGEGYNSINAAIALVALIFNILAVIFVFATYQDARKVAKDNTKNTNFNRVLDILYKQLEYTLKNYEAETQITIGQRSFTSYKDLVSDFKDSVQVNFGTGAYLKMKVETLKKYEKVLRFLSLELEVYSKVITSNNLSIEDKDFFTKLIADNLDKKLRETVGLFQNIFSHFQKTSTYKELKESNANLISNIEFDLNLVLDYLRIPRNEDLDFLE
ncbi:hypothetical protein [Sphingobacterium sp. IITKGP-BTPF85]|uniref:hypothetical protein n=1 Tax=Sphingobacterium sp. IITKGP-BTPF85 TaxID=1338009 RepID=UPI00038A23B5|nr:hypothetical protein [Sphingobacterium sp. IITKGP-BTPF85]KKX48745.1 hypothetical protein L950_0219395 [Sphingobacterium sp. IITKGP-BTPF85]